MNRKFLLSKFFLLLLVLSILTGPVGVSAATLGSSGQTGNLSPEVVHYKLTLTVVGSGTAVPNPDKGAYSEGEPVTLTATPSPGFEFAGWSGDLVSSDNPVVLLMDSDKAVIATFVPIEYSLTVTPVGSGTVDINPDLPSYPAGTMVTLTALPAPGWSFSGWSGDLTGSTSPADVTINDDTTIYANFTQDEYVLNVSINGGGTVTRNPDLATYHYGQSVTLTAVPAPGWTFSNWGGAASGSDNPTSVQILGNTTVAADFTAIEYTLSVGTSGSGSVTRDPDQATYHYGDVVNLTSVPSPGWSFTGWGGMASGTDNPLAVTITGNTSITAAFSQDLYTLTINIVGNGSVSKNPALATYHYGDTVQLTPTADPTWFFAGWSGDLSGTDNPGSIDMDGNKVVTATFLKVEANLGVAHTNVPALIGSGRDWTINLVVSNAGPLEATSLSLVDTLPAGSTFVSASGTDWDCQEAAGLVTCTLASLASGSSSEVTIVVKAPFGPAMITNQAAISSSLPDFTMVDNTSSATVEVSSIPIGGPIIFMPIVVR